MTKYLPPKKSLVLYADDDADDRLFVREAFDEYSHSVDLITFRNGIELLDYVNTMHPSDPLPCLVILDVNMPPRDGKEILRELRNKPLFEDIPVVLFSTSTLPSEIEFAKSMGAGFITKPLHTGQIYHLVDQMLEYCTEDVKQNIRRPK